MEISTWLPTGLTREELFKVEEQHTAYHIGSGDERVLGTPWMISFMERVSNRLVGDYLPAGYMSVGIQVEVVHLAATLVGATVRVRVEIVETARNRVSLKVEAWDHRDKIGEGIHKRAVVQKKAFMDRVLGKSTA